MKTIHPIQAWAIKDTSGVKTAVTISYSRYKTRKEAIAAYEKNTGKKWAQLRKQGYEAVKVPLYKFKFTKPKNDQ